MNTYLRSTVARIGRAGALLAMTALLVNGCSGSSGSIPPTAGEAVAPAPAPQTGTQQTAVAHFTIQWPKHPATSYRHNRPAYISPATMSLIVEVNPDASKPGPVTIANNPGNGQPQTIAIAAPAGIDEFIFSLWDKPQQRGERMPQGNELGQAILPREKIVAGNQNLLKVTIDAITANVTAAPLPNQPFLEANASSGGYDLVGTVPAVFALTAYDAAGDLIVSPGGPTFALDLNPNGVGALSISPVRNKPAEFSVRTIASAPSGYGALALIPKAVDASGTSRVAGTAVPIALLSAIYASYAVSKGKASKVAVYDSTGKQIALSAKAFAGLADPIGITYAPTDQSIFVADDTLHRVYAFDLLGNPVKGYTSPLVSGVTGIAYDPHRNLIFATGSADISAFSPDSGARVTLPSGRFADTKQAQSIAYIPVLYMAKGSNGSLYNAVTNVLAVGNGSTFAIDYYLDSGRYRFAYPVNTPASEGIQPTPIRAMLYDPEISTFWGGEPAGAPLLVSGGADNGSGSGSGFFIGQLPGEYGQGNIFDAPQISSSTAFWGVGLDPAIVAPNGGANYGPEIFVVERDANLIAGMGQIMDGPDGHTIQAPTSSGLSKPQGLAILY